MTGKDAEPLLDLIAETADVSGDLSDTDGTAHYLGHRERLRRKVVAFGVDVLQDYELLEFLLMYAIPRRDVKPLAKELIGRFGSFSAALNASPDELKRVKGVKDGAAALLSAVRGSAVRLAKYEISSAPVIKDWKSLIDYCRVDMGQKKTECLRVLFLDARGRLIRDEILQKGSVSQTPVYPREIAKRALDLSASSVIMVHNHPAGDLRPSKNDAVMTKAVADALAVLDIALIDHLIITKSGYVSLKDCGYLK